MSWPWIVLLALAVFLVATAEWPRIEKTTGSDARQRRQREKRKASLTVVRDPDEEFAESVQRDLDALPTIDEPRV